MKSDFLDCGQVVNTHGIKGEVKVLPWCDTPEYLESFQRVQIDGTTYPVERCRAQGTCVLMKLKGVDDVNAAMKLRERTVQIFREDARLDEGAHFIVDLEGLSVFADGREIGKITEVMQLPSNDVYVVQGDHSYLIPAVKEFVEELNVEAGYVKVRLLEGMRTDE